MQHAGHCCHRLVSIFDILPAHQQFYLLNRALQSFGQSTLLLQQSCYVLLMSKTLYVGSGDSSNSHMLLSLIGANSVFVMIYIVCIAAQACKALM